jgi:uncharacterized protein YjbJ (UPF0337 family)
MNKDQVKGRIKQAKGKIKGATGVLVGNKRLEVEGKIDEKWATCRPVTAT